MTLPPIRPPNLSRTKAAAFQLSKRYGFLHPAQMTIEDIAWDRGVVVSSGNSTEAKQGWCVRARGG